MKLGKKCPKCKKRNEFTKNSARHDGLESWCKICKSKWTKEYYRRHPHLRPHLKRNRPASSKYMRAYNLRVKYGLTEILFREILKFQNFCCAVCGIKRPGGKHNKWQVDHDHKTNKVRGLLCFNCNKHLGYFERVSKQILKYLQKPPAKKVLGE